jgi:NAD+ synthase (glutamine-hydrolysing)
MPRMLRVALAQINPTVGDLVGNADKILEWSAKASAYEADIVAFPELCLPGYPPEDLALKPDFVRENRRQLDRIASEIGDFTVVVGFIDTDIDIYNAAAVIQQGSVRGVYRKCFLPNYAVFDEQRYFRAGRKSAVYVIRGVKVGLTICEDIWYPVGPASVEAALGAEVLLNINASPYSTGRPALRNRMIATRAQDEIAYVAYVNQVGGQDELVFEGGSMVFDWDGSPVACAHLFEEALVVCDLDVDGVFAARLRDTRRRQMTMLENFPIIAESPVTTALSCARTQAHRIAPPLPETPPANADAPFGVVGDVVRLSGLTFEGTGMVSAPPSMKRERQVYSTLVLGVRDYIRKSNAFQTCVVALSGGIDSSLTAAVAVDAVGSDHVIGVSMPSKFSSCHSRTDAALLAKNLGIKLLSIPIEPPVGAMIDSLTDVFAGQPEDITEENLQARVRGMLLMALSNKFGWLVLTTGNKSEVAVGFSTLYGDTAGGFAVLKDVYKTMVFRLSTWRNDVAGCDVIPVSVIQKAPSAELRANQLDIDRLPAYETLDPILEAYIEDDRGIGDIIAQGFDAATVDRVVRLVDANEYKRRQQPPGPRITGRAFGKDRRLPITNKFRPVNELD